MNQIANKHITYYLLLFMYGLTRSNSRSFII